jgi:hypothetical protein
LLPKAGQLIDGDFIGTVGILNCVHRIVPDVEVMSMDIVGALRADMSLNMRNYISNDFHCITTSFMYSAGIFRWLILLLITWQNIGDELVGKITSSWPVVIGVIHHWSLFTLPESLSENKGSKCGPGPLSSINLGGS